MVLKDGEVLKNKATYDPIPVLDVMIQVAKSIGQKLVSPDTGGQGGTSSGKSTGQYASLEEFEADMKRLNIPSTSNGYIKRYTASGLVNKK